MKLLRLCCFLFYILFSTASIGQKSFPWGYSANQLVLGQHNSGSSDPQSLIPIMNCNPISDPPICTNIIANNNFNPTAAYNPNNQSMYFDPFTTAPVGVGYVPHWYTAQGTPNLDDTYSRLFYNTIISAPAPATGYAFMFGGIQGSTLTNEGITQKIAPLEQGNKYSFSFFDRISLAPSLYTATSINFKIVLMKCSDYSLIYPSPDIYLTPEIPQNAQVIY